MIQVIKKSGDKQPFDGNKITRSVSLAAEEAGIEKEEATKLANSVLEKLIEETKNKEEVTTYMLRNLILNTLEETNSPVATSWRKHEVCKK